MTYVEFFDTQASENISACLTYAPDRVIYIGDKSKLMKKHIENYRKVFEERGIEIEFLFRTVSKSSLDNAVEVISEIVEKYDDCVFDVTGGDEMLNLALGIVYSKNPDKNIQIHKFNISNNMVYDCDKDGTTIYRDTPQLSVRENIRIYGGDVVYGSVDEDSTYEWTLDDEFLRDVGLIWDVCKKNPYIWNKQIGIFEDAVNNEDIESGGLAIVIPRADYIQSLSERKLDSEDGMCIIRALLRNDLLTEFEENEGSITVSFKNEQVKRCLTKSGQALEMRVYIAAKHVCDENKPVYNDVVNGVVIDWDGVIHDEETEDVFDTENEIDVMMMHDIVPVFVSCKNGYVSSDELYKLETVAKRFGGKYSRRVLVTTNIDFLGEAADYLRQRAKDMDITMIENVDDLDDEELYSKLRHLWHS